MRIQTPTQLRPCIFISFVLLAGCALGPGKSHVTVRNAAKQTITSITVEADGNTAPFSNVLPGESREATFRIWGDSSYIVHVTFASGKELSAKEGYLTNGTETEDVITVTSSSIEIAVHYPAVP
ncbi:MAG: hypothetical protein QOK37_299 [Thermoanaerobaculia bacterium]|jgi:hypothetical protein|nr:hypothetical protein [Thermoanaerobaculia bacterium]